MAYREYLRMRVRIAILVGIEVLVAALILLTTQHARIELDGRGQSLNTMVKDIPVAAIFGIAGIVSTGMGAFLASLNSLSDTLPSVWTKPVSRERMALSIIGVDVLGLVATWIVSVLTGLAVVANLGLFGKLFYDYQATAIGLLGICAALMAYGNVQAATAWHRGRGGMIAGILWGAYFVLLVLAVTPISPALKDIVVALDTLNPLAYYGLDIHGSNVSSNSLFQLDMTVKTWIVLAIGIAGCAIGTFGWKRMEI
jgi:hypothetical protein